MPKSDIEIAQAATMQRIAKVAKEKLGIADEEGIMLRRDAALFLEIVERHAVAEFDDLEVQ